MTQTSPAAGGRPGRGKGLDGRWLLLLSLSLFALAPLTYPGFPQVWAGFAPLYAVQDLATGQPLAALGRVEGALPYLMGSLLVRLGVPLLASLRWVWGAALLMGGLGAYAALRGRWGRPAALVGALTYLYLPYSLNAVYVRGAVTEAAALGLLPWLLWALERRGWLAPAALAAGLALLGWTAPALLPWLVGLLAALAGLRPQGGAARWGVWGVCAGALAVGLAAWGPEAMLPPPEAAIPFHALLTNSTPWTLGLVALAAFATVLGLAPGQRWMPETALWLAAFAAGCLGALVWPAGDHPTPLALTALAVPPLVASLVSAQPALHRLEAQAALAALIVLAATPLLTPTWTSQDPGRAPLAVWETPGGAGLALLGAELADEGLAVTLRWQVWGHPAESDYTLFLHLVGETGEMRGQRDALLPTAQWAPGALVVEESALQLSAPAAGEALRLAVGWYAPDTLERLPLTQHALPGEPDHRVWIDVP